MSTRFGVAILTAVVAAGCGGARKEHAPVLLKVRLGLPRNQHGLAAFAYEVNDPASPRYGRFLSLEEISARFGASRRVRAAVLAALRHRGIAARVDATGGLVEARMTVDQARKILGGRISPGTLADGTRYVAPRGPVKLERDLRGLVREVVGLARSTSAAPVTEQRPHPQLDRAACRRAKKKSAGIVKRYGISSVARRGFKGQGMTVAVTAVDAFDRRALLVWAQCLHVRAPPVRATGRSVRGVRLGSDQEFELDLDTLTAAAPRLEAIDAIAFDPVGWVGEPFLVALEQASGPPDVMSSSETYCESALKRDERNLSEWVLAAAAAVGVTVVVSAGDTGSSGCYPGDKGLAVQYPASSPFAVAVGGTQLGRGGSRGEAVWFDPAGQRAGGGGYSGALSRPPYQRLRAGRRVLPDVAYVADPGLWPEIPVCDHSTGRCKWAAIGGTSAGAQLVAAGAALVKQVAAADGRIGPGLLNPLLYRYAPHAPRGALVDVVDGTNALFANRCCTAAPGYDAASGWGSIDFAALAAQVRSAAPTAR